MCGRENLISHVARMKDTIEPTRMHVTTKEEEKQSWWLACLFIVYVLATFKVISGRLPTWVMTLKCCPHDLFSKVKQEEMLAFLRIPGLYHLI